MTLSGFALRERSRGTGSAQRGHHREAQRARGEKPRLTEAAAHAKATRIVKQRIIQFDSDPARHEDAAKLRAAFSRYRDRVKERLLGP